MQWAAADRRLMPQNRRMPNATEDNLKTRDIEDSPRAVIRPTSRTKDAQILGFACRGRSRNQFDERPFNKPTYMALRLLIEAGCLEEGSLEEGNLEEGNLEEGNLEEGSLEEGNLEEGNLEEGRLDEGNLEEGNLE